MTSLRLVGKLLVVSALILGACSSDGGRRGYSPGSGGPSTPVPTPPTLGPGPSNPSDPTPTDPTDPTPVSTPYPAGPYGNQVGDTLGDFSSSGYSGTGTYTTLKLSELRANPACKCILVTIGASWCGACQSEQPDLVADVSSDPNFCVLGILQEGPSGSLATKSDLDQWEGAFGQNFPVMLGTNGTEQLMAGYGSSVGLPFALIVQPSTMTVLENLQGYSSDLHAYAQSLCGY
jgi:hypothetical protein